MFDFQDSGAGPIAQGATGRITYPNEAYVTPLLDLTVVTLGIEFIPARPGHIPQIGASNWIIELVSGTQTVPASFQAGSNAAHNNIFTTAARPATADVNGANPPSLSTGGVIAATTNQLLPNLPVFLDVTAAAQGTGNFKLKARFVCRVSWLAVGGA